MRLKQARGGVTLLELSIVLVIIGLIVAIVAGSMGMLESARRVNTTNKLDTIENALLAYRLANNNLPCPGNPALPTTDANYGVTAANPGSCTGGTPAIAAAATDSTNNVVEGAVPFKTLSLPEDFMYDGWGRKFAYAVNYLATASQAMNNEPLTDICGISVTDAGGVAGNRSKGAFYTLVSFGANGHGGYLKSGTRMNAGSTNTDEQTNCHCNASAVATTYAASYVEKDATQNPASSTDTFDDYVYFKERWQMMSTDDTYSSNGTRLCGGPGFRIDGTVASGNLGKPIAVGDVNGDGIPDLIIGAKGADIVYVVFGTASGFPNPLPVTSLDGTNGFSLTGELPYSLAAGDLDHDGYDDIIIGANGHNRVFYGHAAPFNATYDTSSLAACQGFKITDTTGSLGNAVAVGDVNSDLMADIVMNDPSANSGNGNVYVLFGQAGTKTCPGTGSVNGSATTINVDTLTSATNPKGSIINGDPSTTGSFGNALAIGDIDNDTYGDVIIGDANFSSAKGRVYAVFGQASWPNTVAASSLTTTATPKGFIINGTTNSRRLGNSLAVGDVTGDSIIDVASGSDDGSGGRGKGYAWVIKGLSHASWVTLGTGPYDLATLVASNNVLQFQDAESLGTSVAIGDVNHDGVADLIISDQTVTANGSVFVLFGGASLAGRNLDSSPPTGGSDGIRIDCSYANVQSCGKAVGVADVNGDGTKDVIIGVSKGNVTGSNAEGYTYVLYGKASGWTATYNLSTIH